MNRERATRRGDTREVSPRRLHLRTRERLKQLEAQLLTPDLRHNTAEASRLLDEDFVEIGSSGQLMDRQQILDELRDEKTPRMTMSEFQTKPLGPGLVLVTYCLVVTETSEAKRHSMRSSVWRRARDGSWKMVFHQGTLLSS